jgi:hypothetical protein
LPLKSADSFFTLEVSANLDLRPDKSSFVRFFPNELRFSPEKLGFCSEALLESSEYLRFSPEKLRFPLKVLRLSLEDLRLSSEKIRFSPKDLLVLPTKGLRSVFSSSLRLYVRFAAAPFPMGERLSKAFRQR